MTSMTAGTSLILRKPALIERRYSRNRTRYSVVLQHPLQSRDGATAEGWSAGVVVSAITRRADLLLRLRPIGLALRATPSAPYGAATPPLRGGECKRCLTTSYKMTPAATETFREAIFPSIGSRTRASQCSRTRRRRPRYSPPNTKAIGPV